MRKVFRHRVFLNIPDGVVAGELDDLELSELRSECLMKAHQLRHRANAERRCKNDQAAFFGELGGTSSNHPIAILMIASGLRADANDACAEAWEAVAEIIGDLVAGGR